MSKHKKHVFPPPKSFSAPRRAVMGSEQDTTAWTAFEEYNDLPAPQRVERLKKLGINASDPDVISILTKSHFVIPGKTRFECRRCGECCRYARKVAQLTYEPCLFLTADNTCSKHDNRYLVCKWFPFWIFSHPQRGPMLTIKPYCSGFGNGPIIDYRATLERIQRLETAETEEADGAFVIHEVLFVPGRIDWTFPSKTNVDALMAHIFKETRISAVEQSNSRPLEHTGEVHYAHHYTSGLLGAVNSPLFTVNEQGIVSDANEAACELLKLSRSQVVKKAFSSFFVNQDRVAASLSSCLAHGRETASPQRMRLPDESTLPVLLNGLVYRDRSDGLVHGSLVCINPVSAAVFSEVSRSRTYARGLLEASLDGLMVIDKDGAITDVNETVVTLSGRSREDLVGSPFAGLFVDRDKAAKGVEETFKNGSVRNYEITFLSTSGEKIPVSFNATVYRDSEGVVQGVFASARDIRERLAMMRELEEAKNYARGLIECCADLMVTINRDRTITDVNRAATVMTGRSRELLIGAPFKQFFDDPGRATAGVDKTFLDGEVRNYDLNLVTEQGNNVPVSFNASLYRDSKGAVQGVFAIARAKEYSP
jgi:PAS domain S-box-containing protein